ncbi:hypothetical protein GCM10023215_36670 [Pseudonocardia yuanmonensis]|uniref:Secreted protein n=1 Tax=Pseudonocardia yuanmonensis TaxID=1095914 RepID=A0ABP8WVZ9_9PSEU
MPSAAEAFAIRAAFSLLSPRSRSSSYIFSFLMLEFGMSAVVPPRDVCYAPRAVSFLDGRRWTTRSVTPFVPALGGVPRGTPEEVRRWGWFAE